MDFDLLTGNGNIASIIDFLLRETGRRDISEIDETVKLEALCHVLQLGVSQLDSMIADYSPVFRTIKGHVFEQVFDEILRRNHVVSEVIGGDTEVDRRVNGHTLQLKTPYAAGTHDSFVEYKTHKTHGAKSEREGMDYYSLADSFAEYLVGLVSYSPLRIVFLHRDDLPRHPRDNHYIKSPFRFDISSGNGINRFDLIGIDSVDLDTDFLRIGGHESLPRTSALLGVPSRFVLDTILQKSNFRIWDMNMRGFAREITLIALLRSRGIHICPVSDLGARADKCDLVLRSHSGYSRFQIKGITWNGCRFQGENSVVDIESQLSRGRINDHPTQSRLYLDSDFDFLILCMDPSYGNEFSRAVFDRTCHEWQYFCIPTEALRRHPMYPRRINSHQFIAYTEILRYRIDDTWLAQWE